jgi:hypothetical protein
MRKKNIYEKARRSAERRQLKLERTKREQKRHRLLGISANASTSSINAILNKIRK